MWCFLKTLGGSTKGLHTHLSTKHNLKVTSADKNLPSSSQHLNDARTDEKPPTKRRITSYFASEKKKNLRRNTGSNDSFRWANI